MNEFKVRIYTSNWKFLAVEEVCSRDISPEATSTNGSELNDWYGYVELRSDVSGKASEDTILNNATKFGNLRSVGEQNISQEGLSVESCGRNKVPNTVSESRVVTLVVRIGKGLEMERRVRF